MPPVVKRVLSILHQVHTSFSAIFYNQICQCCIAWCDLTADLLCLKHRRSLSWISFSLPLSAPPPPALSPWLSLETKLETNQAVYVCVCVQQLNSPPAAYVKVQILTLFACFSQ